MITYQDMHKLNQKNVANNLNDLYKDNPEKFEEIIDSWSNGKMTKE